MNLKEIVKKLSRDKREVISFSIEKSIIDKICESSLKYHISKSSLVNLILKQHIEELEK